MLKFRVLASFFILLLYGCTGTSPYSDNQTSYEEEKPLVTNTINQLYKNNTVDDATGTLTYYSHDKYLRLRYSRVYNGEGIDLIMNSYRTGTWRTTTATRYSKKINVLCLKPEKDLGEGCFEVLKSGNGYYEYAVGGKPLIISNGSEKLRSILLKNPRTDSKLMNAYSSVVGFDSTLHAKLAPRKATRPKSSLIAKTNPYHISKEKKREVKRKKPKRAPVKKVVQKKPRKPINCSSIDVKKEKVACYAVIVGPKLCTEAVVKNNDQLTQSIGSRIALSAACTNGVKSSFAKEYVTDDLLWNVADELSETACENRKSGGFIKWAVGGYGCVFSGVSWLTKISMANQCSSEIEKDCG